ncbi:MAG: response regulator [Spirochaetia bacterium]
MKRVMVIDDEKIVLDSIKRILEPEGFDVETYQKSTEGLEAASERKCSILLTDIRMPEFSGMHILREMKKKAPEVPVILITGYSTVENAVQAMKIGAADYIEKPFDPDVLIAKVNEALSKSEPPEPGADAGVIHTDTVREILDRAANDNTFAESLLTQSVLSLEEYDLTAQEKLAILTGDIGWLESYLGVLEERQRAWLESRLGSEIWE